MTMKDEFDEWRDKAFKDELFYDFNVAKFRMLLSLFMAEFGGTMLFVTLGCSSILNAGVSEIVVVAIFATAIGTAIVCVGQVSGSIMNPALNVSMVVLGHMSVYRFVLYTVGQTGGACAAMALNMALNKNRPEHFCVARPPPTAGLGDVFLSEFVATFFLSFALCGVVDKRRIEYVPDAAIKFTLAIVAIAYPMAKYSGCAMNPARAFGPALFANSWQYHWVYWVAPYLGALVNSTLYRLLLDARIQDRALAED